MKRACYGWPDWPVATREIAVVGKKACGLNAEDAEMLVTMRKRVGACMYKLKTGVVEEVAGAPTAREIYPKRLAVLFEVRPRAHLRDVCVPSTLLIDFGRLAAVFRDHRSGSLLRKRHALSKARAKALL